MQVQEFRLREVVMPTKCSHRVVIVAMLDSVHVARWLSNLVTLDFEITLFPSSPHRRLHPTIADLLREHHHRMSLSSFWKHFSLPVWMVDKIFKLGLRRSGLRRAISKASPHFVHALESQSGGYLAVKALEASPVPMGLTLFGSDLYWFARFPKHREKIRKLLKRTSYLWCECSRDIKLARTLGYEAEIFPTGPVAGGFTLTSLMDCQSSIPASRRPYITVKGYTNFVGQAGVVLAALRRTRREIKQYTTIIYSATVRARLEVLVMRRFLGMSIRAIPKYALNHEEILLLFAKSSVFVGVSDSDGLPSSTCEALAVGSFVIQSGTSCCEEIISHLKDGYILSNNSRDDVMEALRFWLANPDLVDSASLNNRLRMSYFLDPERRRQEIVDSYRHVFARVG